MAINVRVITYNEAINGEGGFHEIHESKFLSSPEHAMETVKNIVDLNLQFCKDTRLSSVEIETNDFNTAKILENYYAKDEEIDFNITDLGPMF